MAREYIDIAQEHYSVENRNCKPQNIKRYYDDNYVIDENESVKWNREQVKLNNQRYDREYNANLNQKKNRLTELRKELISALAENIKLSEGVTERLFNWLIDIESYYNEHLDEAAAEIEDMIDIIKDEYIFGKK